MVNKPALLPFLIFSLLNFRMQ